MPSKIGISISVYASRSVILNKRKFNYTYEFISYKNKLIFRGLSVDYYGKVHTYSITTGSQWNTIVFMYPGMQKNILCDPLNNLLITELDVPDDVRMLRKRKDIVLPKEIIEAVEKKVGIKVGKEFAKL